MMIEADGLSVRYRRKGPLALDRVSFVAAPGVVRAVVGPNGSGKTTLLKTLLGVIRPLEGRALLGGRPVADWSARERARTVGAVAQSEAFPFPLTVTELVSMGRYPHLPPLAAEGPADRTAVAAALSACDVDGLAHREVSSLSGGELQRARIARALAQEPKSLVLDEPSANLDLSHRMEVFQLLRREADRGLTVLVVTHELELAARFADQVTILNEGRVAADGSPRAVVVEDVLTDVYGWPVSVSLDPISGTPRVSPLGERMPPTG